MHESQDAIRTALSNILAQNGPAEAALLGLFAAAAVFTVGWSYRHRMAGWWAVGTQAAGLLIAVAVLGLQVSHQGWLTEVDHSVTTWMVAHRYIGLDPIALAVTNGLGPVTTTGLTAVLATVAAVRARSILCGAVVVATVGGASALCFGIKLVIARARPPLAIQQTLETDYSFPSGHVTGAAALFGISAVLFGMGRSRLVQGTLAAVAGIGVLAVALSRLYLGVHWLTDTIAGALLGAAVLTVGAAMLRAVSSDTVRRKTLSAELQANFSTVGHCD